MVSKNKTSFKRIMITIIVTLIILALISFTVTKFIYDGIFSRYDCAEHATSEVISNCEPGGETLSFYSGENKLSAKLYRSAEENEKRGLIIIAPGFHACKESYIEQTKSLLELGWSVFAFDPTGCCGSEGKNSKGFSQELLDLDSAIKYIETNGRFGYNSLVLLGHSRGGYAVCCALSLNHDISAVVSVSGINSAMEGVIGASESYVGPLAYGNYGFLWLYQAMIFGSETLNLRADSILNESKVPALIIHGSNDSTVPLDKHSIMSHKDNIRSENVKFSIRRYPDNDGHTDILFDDDGTANDELMNEINVFLTEHVK